LLNTPRFSLQRENQSGMEKNDFDELGMFEIQKGFCDLNVLIIRETYYEMQIGNNVEGNITTQQTNNRMKQQCVCCVICFWECCWQW